MSRVHKKLMKVRVGMQDLKLKKSGYNKFAGYDYFELGDFLPVVQKLFDAAGLCGVVSYGIDLATLTITDLDDGSIITITSPMAEANLKGCHPIQNLGAVETYTRRYLWTTALEIVEHDALDATTGKVEFPKNFKDAEEKSIKSNATMGAWDALTTDEKTYLQDVASEVLRLIDIGKMKEALDYIAEQELDNDHKVALTTLFDSKTRAAMKKFRETLTA